MKEPGQIPDPVVLAAEFLAYAQVGLIHPTVEAAIRADEAAKVRAENERLREALIEIKNADPVDMALDPQWPARIAKHALDKVEE
jgi:hypothetical protein